MEQLPDSIDYFTPLPQIPKGAQATSMVSQPINGSVFTAGSQIWVDLPQKGFLVPDSLAIRYKGSVGVVPATGAASSMIGLPYLNPFVRSEVYCGSTQLEVISQYNQVSTLVSNITMDVAQKYALQSAYGYATTGPDLTMDKMDGRVCVNSTTFVDNYSVAGPLPNILSNAKKLIPLFLTGSMRVILTVDAISNMFVTTTAVNIPTTFSINNFELVYEIIDFGYEIQQAIRMKAPKIFIKSQTLTNQAQVAAAGTQGVQDYVFNIRNQSIKAVFASLSGTAANSLNKWGDSFDVTQRSGEYSLQIAGQNFPSRPLSALNNPSGILLELKRASTAFGNDYSNVYDKQAAASINAAEFGFYDDSTTATTLTVPSKFILGFHTETLHNNNALLSGISTQNTPVTLRISSSTNSVQAHNINLIVLSDALLEIDCENAQVHAKV